VLCSFVKSNIRNRVAGALLPSSAAGTLEPAERRYADVEAVTRGAGKW